MNGYFSVFSIIIISVILIGCSNESAVDTQAEIEKIRELDRQWQEAMSAKDVKATIAFFAENGIQMPAHGPELEGMEVLNNYYEQWLPHPDIISTFTPEIIEVAASGDLAYDKGVFHFSMETPNGQIVDTGKYVIVWKKIEGEWKAILDISNSDLPIRLQ